MSFAYMTLYTGDYLRDTRHLSCAEHGIYLLLLMHYWDAKGPLPLDERKTAAICGARSGDEIEAMRRVLADFFVKMEDGHYNQRMEREIFRAKNISEVRKNAAYSRHKGRDANAMQMHSKSNASALNTTTTTTTTTNPNTTAYQPPVVSGNSSSKKNQRRGAASAAPFVLPDWIPKEHWAAYEEMRNKIRKPMTDSARRMAVLKLDNLNEQGHPPGQVLRQSVFNGWQGLFPIREVKA
jgi:uncharacterized protein YdaU (DUF1376 family)